MKKLIALGLLLATAALGSAALAAEGGTLQDRELQKLFEESSKVRTPESATPVMVYKGYDA